jgi:hypothetical protein
VVALLHDGNVVAEARAGMDHGERADDLAKDDDAEADVGPPADALELWVEGPLERVLDEDEEVSRQIGVAVGEEEGWQGRW